jgi:hypothetical protein
MEHIPEYLLPGAVITVDLKQNDLTETGAGLQAQITHVFTPFTLGQVLVARLSHLTTLPNGMVLPESSYILLKIYDPRFCELRHRGDEEDWQPWNVEAERKAAATRAPCDGEPELPGTIAPEDPEGYEEWYFQYSEVQFAAETTAYSLLKNLLGDGIPIFFGAGSLQLPDRHISPRVALLEYIPDSRTLKDMGPALVTPALAQTMAGVVKRFAAYGVVHADVNPSNILFSPYKRPTRGVIIDFAAAIIRADTKEDEWTETVRSENDVGGLKFSFLWTLKISKEDIDGREIFIKQNTALIPCGTFQTSSQARMKRRHPSG